MIWILLLTLFAEKISPAEIIPFFNFVTCPQPWGSYAFLIFLSPYWPFAASSNVHHFLSGIHHYHELRLFLDVFINVPIYVIFHVLNLCSFIPIIRIQQVVFSILGISAASAPANGESGGSISSGPTKGSDRWWVLLLLKTRHLWPCSKSSIHILCWLNKKFIY